VCLLLCGWGRGTCGVGVESRVGCMARCCLGGGGSAGGSIGDTLHDAMETTVSGASVAVLILWTIAVTGWTGFQVCPGGGGVVRAGGGV
jgi:hypothetical protein